MISAQIAIIEALSLREVKKMAWKLFSEYIRKKYADERGFALCVTCGKRLHWKQLQAGHFIGGRTNAVLFEERGVHPQCVGCNYFGDGRANIRYREFMEKTYGKKVITGLEKDSRKTVKFEKKDYIAMMDVWTEKLSKINVL